MHERRDWLTKKYDDNFSIMNLLELVFRPVVTEIYDSDKPEGTVCKDRHSHIFTDIRRTVLTVRRKAK